MITTTTTIEIEKTALIAQECGMSADELPQYLRESYPSDEVRLYLVTRDEGIWR
jgi:hypothetical protein